MRTSEAFALVFGHRARTHTYGFSTDADSETLRAEDLSLRQAVNILFNSVDLIDMETAQFYYFCEKLFDPDKLNYVAVKGAANFVTEPASQTTNSLTVLQTAVAASFDLLDLLKQPAYIDVVTQANVVPKEASTSKLAAKNITVRKGCF